MGLRWPCYRSLGIGRSVSVGDVRLDLVLDQCAFEVRMGEIVYADQRAPKLVMYKGLVDGAQKARKNGGQGVYYVLIHG